MRPLLHAGLLVVLVAACAAPMSTDAPPTGQEAVSPPVACMLVEAPACARIAAAAIESLGPAGAGAVWVEVDGLSCPRVDCGPGVAGLRQSRVTVELAGAPAATVAIDAIDGRVTVAHRSDIALIALEPASPRIALGVVQLELGHCGLDSGIDIDGSFWNPVGAVPADHPDAINAARATVTFSDPDHAVLRTAGGLVIELVRHQGVKHFPGCD